MEDCKMIMKNRMNYYLNTFPLELCLFVFVFFDRYFRVFLLSQIITVTDQVQHYYFLIEKITIVISAVLILLRVFEFLLLKKRPLPGVNSLVLLMFFAAVLFSTFVNYGQDFKYDYMMKLDIGELLVVSLLFFNISINSTKRQLDKAIEICANLIFYSVLILGILSLYLYFGGSRAHLNIFGKVFVRDDLFSSGHAGSSEARYHGFFTYPTTLGFRCSLACASGMLLLWRKKINKYLVILGFIVSASLIIISDARTGMIQMLIIALFWVYLSLRKLFSEKKSRLLIIAFVTLVLFVILLVKRDSIFTAINQIQENSFSYFEKLSSHRVWMWRQSVQLFLEKPLFGFGWNGGMYYSDVGNTHNLFFTVLYWHGLVGLIPLIAFFIILAIKIVLHREYVKKDPYLLCIVLTVFIQSMLDMAIIADKSNPATYMFWLMAGYLCNLTKDAV